MAVRTEADRLRWWVRALLIGFIVGLVLSGLTAFPLTQEVRLVTSWLGAGEHARPEQFEGLTRWMVTIRDGVLATNANYPFIFYGTDWLAFAHLVIAALFWGPIKDPVRNLWVIHWGILACISVIPLSLICGPIRGIPFGWRILDCSFGVVGIVPLLWCAWAIKRIEQLG